FGVPLAAINMSVGGKKSHSQPCDEDARAKIIQNLDSVGIATIISAGNNGYADGISAPACISKAISVGATDKTGQLWPQSNRAGILDLLAPGVGIESALPGDLTAAKDGTSMAAPHVAGAWAIMKAHNPKASVAEILGKLKNTGQDVGGMPRIQIDAALPQVQAAQGLNDGLVAYYTFDGNANDASGNGNHGTEQGGFSYVTGKIGQAAQFDGIDDYVDIPKKNTLNPAQITISTWIKISDVSQVTAPHNHHTVFYMPRQYLLAIFGSSYPNNIWSNGIQANELSFAFNPHWYWYSTEYFPEQNQFEHVVLTFDEKMVGTLYINGQYVYEVGYSSPISSNADCLMIGARTCSVAQAFFNGLIDDFRIYNRVISESEIKQLYGLASEATLTLTKTGKGEITSTDNSINCGESCEADYEVDSTVTLTATPATGYSFTGWRGDCSGASASITVTMDVAKSCEASFEKEVVFASGCDVIPDGLVACYPFNGNANDASGNGNHGTVHGATLIEDRFGNVDSAYKFSQNNGITIPNNASQQIATNQISISAWITLNKDIPKTQWRIVNKQEANSISWGLELFGNGYYGGAQGNNITFHNSDRNRWIGCVALEVNLVPMVTYHVAAISENNVAKIYLDGKLIKTCTNMLGIPSSINSYIVIGFHSQFSGYFFNGKIDDVAIYNRALSESEIQTLYGSEKATLTLTKTGEGEITSIGNTINCGETCQADYEVESTVTLTATPASGSTFTGWSGDCSGTFASTTVTMDAAKSCTAHFDKSSGQKTITINKTGKGRATVKIEVKAEDRTHLCKTDCSEMTRPIFTANEILLTATTAKGFIFNQWAGECSGTDNRITVPMTASKTCTADFDLDPNAEMYPLTVNNKEGSQGRLVAKGGIDCGEKCTAYYPGGQ
ncbi:MAG: LamG-like jellyroll fold domain-containing protein, partial [Candidatus Parabeggiatoa sp.]|nr:LamG-like jellyroll fold domain-containing protein [Candidatus Parabeggiatoa sp.]